tara:strand:- start:316 stop:447 length:132 start_codon:yes stop_codon:yes gene_type:complete
MVPKGHKGLPELMGPMVRMVPKGHKELMGPMVWTAQTAGAHSS